MNSKIQDSRKVRPLSISRIRNMIRARGLMIASTQQIDKMLEQLVMDRLVRGMVDSLVQVMDIAGKKIVLPSHLALAISTLSIKQR